MNLPDEYAWVPKLRGLPNNIRMALAEYGVAEVVGRGSNKTIISWRDELNQAGASIKGFSDDDIAWCGLFVAIISYRRMKRAEEVIKDPLWARNWMKYGVKSPQASLGDVLVFERGSGGHVGFYIAEDEDCYHVLAGNQGNKVSILRVKKNRLLAVRRPPYANKPQAAKPYWVKASGNLSLNEA